MVRNGSGVFSRCRGKYGQSENCLYGQSLRAAAHKLGDPSKVYGAYCASRLGVTEYGTIAAVKSPMRKKEQLCLPKNPYSYITIFYTDL